MKIFIVVLLIFSSFSNGEDPGPSTSSTTDSTSSTTVESTTSSTTATSTSTAQPTNTTTHTTQTTASALTSSLPPSSTTVTPSPTTDVSINVTWAFNSGTKATNVVMIVKNLGSSEWAAIGLGQNPSMGEAHVFMCKRLANNTVLIQRYINPGGHQDPQGAGSEDGGVFTPLPSQFMDGVITCQFKLSNFTTGRLKQLGVLNPLSQSGNYHPLFAIGLLDDTNEPQQHSPDSRIAQSDTVQLNQDETILYRIPAPPADNSLTYIRTHGIIMVMTWMFIVSTGILISRYCKKSWLKTLICGKAAWFAAHRFLMSVAAVLTILGFLFILVALGGTWVDRQDGIRAFAHSITGALVISLAFFQPFIALFRCEPDSRYRFIFNYIHGFVGFTTLILSIATLFLATYFKLFKTDVARTIMIIWVIWIVIIFAAFEFIQHYFRRNSNELRYAKINSSNTTIGEIVEIPTSPTIPLTISSDDEGISSEEKLKNILLSIHILVAAILSIIFSTLIA